MQIDPFKGTILLHQIFNILDFFIFHSGKRNKQDAAVNISGILERLFDILFRRMGETAHLHTADHHFALLQHKDGMQQQCVAEDLRSFRNPPGLAHHMGAVYDEGGGNKTLHPLHGFHNLRLCGMMLRHIGGAQHCQPHAAGEMSRIYHRDVFKGFCRLKGVLISLADVLGHCDVDDILGLCQLFREELLIVLHFRRLGVPLPPSGNMHQQFVRFQLLAIQEPALVRTHVVGAYGDAELFSEGFREVAHAVGCDQDRASFNLLKDQDILSDLGLTCLLAQLHQFLWKNTQHSRLQQCAADRLGQITAEALLSVEQLVVAACVGSQGDHRDMLAQTARLFPQHMEAFNAVHLRHHVVHKDAVIVVVLGQLQTFGSACGGINLDFCLRKQLAHHHQVHIVVIHHKDMGIRRFKALAVGFSLMDLCP